MRQLNVKSYYDLGKNAQEIETHIQSVLSTDGDVSLAGTAWAFVLFRDKLLTIMQEPCALPSASQRATRALIDELSGSIPENLYDIFEPQKIGNVEKWKLQGVSSALSRLETILGNDMPEMSTYAVSQIGIFRTDDLINRAERQISTPLLVFLKDKAKEDIIEAGKCLAFHVSTASAFHSCRALETCIDQYYESLAGKPYESSPRDNNWGAKINALTTCYAEVKITEFLTHIRKQYRNPVTHPEVTVDEHEAKDLFGASISAISMLLGAIKIIADQNHTPLLPGLENHAAITESASHGLQEGMEE